LKGIPLLLSVLLGLGTLSAQGPGRLPLRTYGVEQGMASEVVSALAQDRQGLIWAGTEAGLHFFNGQTFEPYPGELPSQMIHDLLAEPDGTLWVATQGGLAQIKDRKIQFLGPLQGLPEGKVQALARDLHGHLWVLTGQGLHVENGPLRFQPAPALPNHEGATLLFAHPSQPGPWVLAGRSLWRWDPTASRWRSQELPPMDRTEAFLGLALDGTGQTWLRTSQNLWRRPGRGAWQLSRTRMKGGFSGSARLERDAQGWVWFDDPKGLWRARGEQQEVFADRAVVGRGALVDRDGDVWLRTQKGVARVMGAGRWRSHGTADGLPSPTIWLPVRDDLGRLWVATEEGLCVSDGAGWKQITRTRTLNVYLGPDQAIWATGSPGGTVHRVDLRSLGVESLRVDVLPVGRIVSGFVFDGEGRPWVADPTLGLARGRREGATWRWERVQVDGNELLEIRNLLAGPNGEVLVSHLKGVAVWKRGEWSHLSGLLNALPSAMAFHPQGDLFVAYLNRPVITRFHPEGTSYQRVEDLDPFIKRPQIMVFSLGFEANGRLWMGTSQGVGRLVPGRPETLRLFTKDDGLVTPDCDDGSLFIEPNRVWIGTTQGLASYRTDLPELPTTLHPPYFLSAGTSHQSLPLDAPLLRLPRGNKDLDLRFLVPSYRAMSHLSYQARLAGVDREWVPLEQPRVRYPSFHPGIYHLEVRGVTQDGGVGPASLLRFEILPEWWESRVALACYVVLGGGALFGLVKLRQIQLETRNRELREEVARQTQAVQLASQAKSAFLANMSHELRTPLNAILLYSELLQEDATDHGLLSIQADAAKIQGAGRHLLSLIDDILDVSKIEAGHMKLHVEEMDLPAFLTDLISALRPLIEKNGNHFHTDLSEAPASLKTDSLRLRQVLSNLLSNAGKFTRNGSVHLRVSASDHHIVFTISDTGIGMTEDELARVFLEFVQAESGTTKRFGGTGLGLALVKRFTRLLGGTIEAQSQPEAGTTFTLKLPLEGPPEEEGIQQA